MAVINVHKISKQAAANAAEGKKGYHGFLNKDMTDLLDAEENRKSRKKDCNPTGFSDFTFFSSTFIPLEHGMDARDASNCPSIIQVVGEQMFTTVSGQCRDFITCPQAFTRCENCIS